MTRISYWLIVVPYLLFLVSFVVVYPNLILASLNIVTISAVVPLKESSTLVTASLGGTSIISAGNNELTITAPANFMTDLAQVTIKVQAIDSNLALSAIGAPDGGFAPVGNIVFNVRAQINPITTMDSFDKPITFSLRYPVAAVYGFDESTLLMYHYHQGSWQALDNCNVNTADKTITCSTTSFSMFALFAKPQNSNTAASTGTASRGGASLIISQGPVPANPSNMPSQNTSAKNSTILFNSNLKLGDSSPDVKRLQQFLNTYGYVISMSGLGSAGQETEFFGAKTKASLLKFQEGNKDIILKPNGLNKGTGFFGASTRKFINDTLSSK